MPGRRWPRAWHSLRAKIIAWSFVPAAVILAAVALVAYYAYQEVTRDLVMQHNQELARLKAGQIDNELTKYSQDLDAWGQTVKGNIDDRALLSGALRQAGDRLAVFDGGVVVLDGNGVVAGATPTRPGVLGDNWSGRPYFQQAAQSRQPAYSDVVADGPGGAPVVVVAVPLLGTRGEVVGAALGMFRLGASSLSAFYGSLVKLRLGGAELAYVVDGAGRVIYHGDTNLIGADLSGQDTVKRVVAGGSGPIRGRNQAGDQIVASFAPVPATSWGLVIEADWSVLLRASQGYRRFLLLLLAMGVVVPAGVVAFGVRRITRPILDLVSASKEVARGNFGQTVTASTGDEVEELVTQFNHMSAELQRSYAALQEREERFSLAMQGANDGLWDWDLTTDQVYYSPRWKSMLGYSGSEIEGSITAWDRLIHPDDRDAAWRAVRDFIAGEIEKFDVEFQMRHKDGHYVAIRSRALGVRQVRGGPVVRLVGTHVDITERKQAEQALQERLNFEQLVGSISTEFVNLGLEDIDAGIQHALQAVGEFTASDRSYVFLLSVDRKTMSNSHEWCAPGIESVKSRAAEASVACSSWLMDRLAQLKVVYVPRLADLPPEAGCSQPDSRWQGIRSLICVPMVYRGVLVGFVGLDSVSRERAWAKDNVALLRIAGEILVNALEHRWAQKALRESEAQFRGIVEYANLGIAVIQDSRFQFVNSHYADLAGHPVEQMIGAEFADYIVPEERERVLRFNARRMAGQDSPSRYETVMLRGSGERVYVEVSAGIIPYQGRPAAFTFLRDVTQRRLADEEIRRQNVFLAALHDTTLGVVSRLDIGELLETVVERAVSLVGATYGFLYLVCPDRNAIEVQVGTGVYHKYIGQRLKRGEGLSGKVWQLGQPLAVDDYSSWPGRSTAFEQDTVGPSIGVPLMSGTDVVGVLGIARLPQARPFQRDEFDLIGRFAQLVSVALENARLHMSVQEELADRVRAEEALQHRLAFETLITTISTDFINRSPEEIEAGIAGTLEAIGEFTGSDRSYVFVFSDDGTRMDNVEEWCRQGIDHVQPFYRDQPVEVLPWATATIKHLATVHAPSVAQLPAEAAVDRERCLAHDPPTRSILLVPMIYRGRAVGFLGFDAVGREMAWPGDSIALLRITGEILANALQHKQAQNELQSAYATLEQRVNERTRELAALNDISAVASRSLDLREIMNDALDKTLEAIGMDLGLAWRLDQAGDCDETGCLRLVAQRGVSASFLRIVDPLPFRGSMIEEAATAGRPLVWATADYPMSYIRQAVEDEGIPMAITVPLLVQQRLVGAINLGSRQVRAVSPEELAMLAAVGQQVGVAIDNARLYQAEQDRREEAERRRQVAEGLREVLAALNSTRALDEILAYVVRQARELLGSNAIALYRLDPGDKTLHLQAYEGLDLALAAQSVERVGSGAAGRSVATRQPAVVNAAGEPGDSAPGGGEDGELPADSGAAFQTAIGVPLILKDEVYGSIVLFYRGGRGFAEDEIALAAAFADQAALAIENARLRAQAEESAAITERARLARELHDSVTQSLYSVNLYAEAAARLLVSGDHLAAAEHLRDLRDTAQEALREMRLLIFQLRPPALEHTGLAAALQSRLDGVESRGGMRAELHVTGTEQLPPAVQAELYHIAQEALNNVLKHAHARTVRVELAFADNGTCLEVRDDGAGFDVSAIRARGGLGLPGMHERAERIGGRLSIDSAPGQGTRLRVEVPLQEAT